MLARWTKKVAVAILATALVSCGFQPRGEQPLAKDLHTMHLRTSDPYGVLAKNLRQSLKMSHVHLVSSAAKAQAVLWILRDSTSQEFLGVSGTQQIRQYKLIATVVFQLTDKHGNPIIAPQTLQDTRNITVQSNQILGSSNEANLYFKQMQRGLASAIMYRIASVEITNKVNAAFKRQPDKQVRKHKKRRKQAHA